jgi:hypothetical protein
MADFFKIFTTDLDETRMRYAMSKLPETWPVWTAVLMECAKHKSDRFAWGASEHELFGFSDRLKISIQKVGEAVNLLIEIRYCELKDGMLIVLKWGEKQSDYLNRKSQGYWENRRKSHDSHSDSPCITVNHGKSRLEERRGEEIKGEEIINTHTGADAAIPTLQEVLTYAEMRAVTVETATKFFNHHQDNDLWINQHGRIIKWKTKLVNWQAQDRQLKSQNANSKTHRPTTPDRNAGTYNANASTDGLKKLVR